jgi:quinol monooxygenase YgiN
MATCGGRSSDIAAWPAVARDEKGTVEMPDSNDTAQIWTLGVWVVKEGQAAAFREAWERFAHWTAQQQPGAGEAYLLQDLQQPQRFISFGPWENPEAVQAWRQRPEFADFVSQARALCDEFQPNSLRQVAHIARGPTSR